MLALPRLLTLLLLLTDGASEVLDEAKRRELADQYNVNDGRESDFGCPKGKWGVVCADCLRGVNVLTNNVEICSGHGSCDGTGTPYGTGECHCVPGFGGALCNGPTCEGRIVASNDDFLAFKDCREISGPLQIIGSSDITNLDPLLGLTTIGGLDKKGNSIYIYKNSALGNIEGLKNVVDNLAGALVIDDNAVLTSLDGIEGIKTIGENIATDGIYVVNNPSLTSINALKGLQRFPKGQTRIWGNPSLTAQARNSWHDTSTHMNHFGERSDPQDPRFNTNSGKGPTTDGNLKPQQSTQAYSADSRVSIKADATASYISQT